MGIEHQVIHNLLQRKHLRILGVRKWSVGAICEVTALLAATEFESFRNSRRSFIRDIKATNILWDPKVIAKVVDLGLSRLAPVANVEGVVLAKCQQLLREVQ
ncbi:hypothetical protein L1987_66929 [Smallanthus sonchifolius]|uniref:Uncharacterized protein n=1 Tax=Smallanthus sonchifolius TaxID=185202 RepID=A0ACB9BYR0_9ASTR|nr:hypothetical protein L1987_66929 [Smallanthus sonchifolius]